MGYHRAGFDVVGVDIVPQPNYPFRFIRADALDILVRPTHYYGGWWKFDAISASPPCQHFTKYRNAVKDIKDRYADLIEPTRGLLRATGLPYVMENVEGAPLEDPIMLCGSMFDLDVRRHRIFETKWPLQDHQFPCRHKIWSRRFKSSTGRKKDSRMSIEIGSWDEPLERQKAAMAVDWEITTRELSEAIPPAYTEFIGHQLLQYVNASRAEARGLVP